MPTKRNLSAAAWSEIQGYFKILPYSYQTGVGGEYICIICDDMNCICDQDYIKHFFTKHASFAENKYGNYGIVQRKFNMRGMSNGE